ncbi:UNVERIFIED_CONTAM: hypothetical protein PYX00_003615 [Menopon gallinae]|uniref:Amidase domain-containing protein n=1 Tax=Menopon gallinae TaxID=328185 RepID=A0AAW2I103_9NEOP
MANRVGSVVFRVFQTFAKVLFGIIYRKRGQAVARIDDPIIMHSAVDLARKIRSGELKSVDVVAAFVRRIKHANPSLNFMVDERFEECLREARIIDERIASGEYSKEEMVEKWPFLGVPYTIKASIAKKGFTLSGGLVLRENFIATEDAEVVTRMQEAGAILLGSTNVSELCLWWESVNPVHGRTRNSYDSNRGVGGSSGGEGCIQAMGGSAMGIGSDIGGSIRIPAHFNGIFGHKPSNGIGPNTGHFPYPRHPETEPFLVLGPMSRFATDLLPMFKIMVRDRVDELRLNEKVDVSKLKYFYMEDDGGSVGVSPVDPEIRSALRRVVDYLKERYGIEAKKLDIKGLGESMMLWTAHMTAPGGPKISDEISGFKGKRKDLPWEIVKTICGARQHTLPVLIVGLLEKMSMKYGDKRHRHFMEVSANIRKEIEEHLGSDGVFIYPTLPIAAPYHGEPMFKPFDISYTALFNWLGYPATHCTLGLNSEGLPIGVQVAATEMQDRLTLAVAVELEKAFGGWVPPSV